MGERGELPAEMLIRWAGDRPHFFKRRNELELLIL